MPALRLRIVVPGYQGTHEGCPYFRGSQNICTPCVQQKVWNMLRPYLGGLFLACAARMAWARASNSLAAAPRFMARSRRA